MMTREGRAQRRWIVVAISSAAIAIVVISWYILFPSRFFSMKTIDCSMDSGPCPSDIVAELERHRGESSLFFQTAVIASKIEKADLTVKDINIRTRLPQTLQVLIRKRVPSVQFAESLDASSMVAADQDGVFLGAGNRIESIPIIIVSNLSDMIYNQKLLDVDISALHLLTALQGTLDGSSAPMVDSRSLIVKTTDGIRVRFSLDKSSQDQILALQLLMKQAKISLPYREIDLRFEQPILKQ